MPKQYPISICMAGAVSAGAYSAGAMSVLISALRRLEDDSLNLPHRPQYDILIKGMTGASAGSIQAVLSSLDLFSGDTKQELGYDAWLSSTIDTLLTNDDLNTLQSATSILNSQTLRNNAKTRIKSHTPTTKWPKFIARDYQLRLSVTNLRGIPYELSLPEGNEVPFGMNQHNEYIKYYFSDSNQQSNNAHIIKPLQSVHQSYNVLVNGALASSAFPLAFSAVEITRPGTDQNNQLTSKKWFDLTSAKKQNEHSFQVDYDTKTIHPKWNEAYGDINKIYSVDGGATKNEPLTEAFKILFGDDIDQWEVLPDDVNGKVLFIDPFPNPLDKEINLSDLRVDKSLGALISALMGQARFSERMVVSKKHQNRVGLLYPKRPGLKEKQLAIKSGAIGGFSGFLKKEFMEHDYELGKLNMQRFLRYHFTIEQNHPYLKGQNDYIAYWAKDGRVPIIPIYEKALNDEYQRFSQGESGDDKVSYYKKGLSKHQAKFTVGDRARLKKQLKTRFKKVIPILLESHSGKSEERYPDIKLGIFERFKNSAIAKWASVVLMNAGTKFIAAGFLTNTIIKTIEDSLDEQENLDYKLKSK